MQIGRATTVELRVVKFVASVEEHTMRKMISLLDDDERNVLLEITDVCIASFSSGLIVAILKSAIDLFV
jgi:hypothetical protein